MDSYGRNIRPYVEAELRAAAEAESQGNAERAFAHLERAHVLGQASTALHVRVHWRMLLWGARQRSARECVGQIVRIVGAATKTAIGMVPSGNTGGSNVSPVEVMPVSPELEQLIRQAQASDR